MILKTPDGMIHFINNEMLKLNQSVTNMSEDKNELRLQKIEKLLNTSNTSSIFDTLTRIQQEPIIEVSKRSKFNVDLTGFSKHESLSDTTRQKHIMEEPFEESISKEISQPKDIPVTASEDLPISDSQISVITPSGIFTSEKVTSLKVGGKTRNFSLKPVVIDQNLSDEEIKTKINGSHAGIIILPSFTDINDIQKVINQHVSELWSFNGLGPVPFVVTVIGGEEGAVSRTEFEKTIQGFIDNLTPITRGNYGFGIKYLIVKTFEKDLKKIMRTLAILLISYNRFKMQKSSNS